MASTSFKQACPSCEALVPIKDASMVGKKVDCPKCKYRFQVEKPKAAKNGKGQTPKFRGGDDDEVEELEELDNLEEVDEDEDDEPRKPQVKAGAKGGSKPQVKKKPAAPVADDEEEEEDERPAKKKPASSSKSKDLDEGEEEVIEDDDAGDDEDDGKKKKKGGSKLVLGLALAGIGLVVLVVAAFMMLGGSGGSTTPTGGRPAGAGAAKGPEPVPPEAKGEDGQKEAPPQEKKVEAAAPEPAPAAATNEVELALLTNFLPNDTDDVAHVHCRDLLEPNSVLRDAAFNNTGVLDDVELRKRLGFSILAIDDLIRAENYKGQGWVYTIVHFREPINEANLKTALGLKALPAIKNQVYYQTSEYNPWFDHLSRLSFGVPAALQQLNNRPANRPTFVRVHGPHTLILGDKAPVEAFLQVEGAFPILSNKPGAAPSDPGAAAPTNPLEGTVWIGKEDRGDKAPMRFEFLAGDMVKLVEPKETIMGTYNVEGQTVSMTFSGRATYTGTIDNKAIAGEAKDEMDRAWKWSAAQQTRAAMLVGSDLRAEMYLTIRPELKVLLDKMEAPLPGSKEKILYSGATNMDTARVDVVLADAANRVTRRPRRLWDVAQLLNEAKPRVKFLGTCLAYYKEARLVRYRNDIKCGQEIDVRELQKDLVERVAPQVARFAEKLLGQRVDLPKIETAPPMTNDPGAPMPMPVPGDPTLVPPPVVQLPDRSQMSAVANATALEFTLNLVLDTPAVARVYGVAAMAAGALRAEMDLSNIVPARHALAQAGNQLGVKGLSTREVAPGQWPPGAFPRPATNRLDREPLQRVSWLAGLLPYLGHETLYSRIEFKDSWRDPGNWLAAQTLVPQFLDPSYPDAARRALAPGVPLELAATHFVGIAGVGLDAAGYRPGDPATLHQRGVLNYEQSLSVPEVQKGRGLANTILMIQVPHDGVAGVTPWIAGGGSTLRGVPEKNSIAPFVLSTDRGGKTIQHKAKKGTFALMTDGSVRFIDENISDAVFQAMCAPTGPAPEKFDLDKNEHTPLDPDPNKKAAPKVPAKKAAAKAAGTKAPDETKPAAEAKPAEAKPAAGEEKKPADVKSAVPEEKKAAPKADEKKAPPPAERKAPLAAPGVEKGPAPSSEKGSTELKRSSRMEPQARDRLELALNAADFRQVWTLRRAC